MSSDPGASSEHQFDLLVVGAGLVGASLAGALAGSGRTIALVERLPPPVPAAEWDSRVYAIGAAGRDFLAAAGAWSRLDPARVQRVSEMSIAGDRADGRIGFSAYDAGVEALAWIVESGRLQHALWQVLAERADVVLLTPAACTRLDPGADRAALALDDGRVVRARLVVGADGAQSWVRREAGIGVRAEPYGQLGVVANFACARAHGGTAFQWFRADGVLAYLPLPGERMSMVWSTPEAHARELLALPPDELCRRVAEAGAHALGALELLAPPQAFPLQRLAAESMIGPRIALVGDAAHVVHPLAGQGVNLGFGDARALAALLRSDEAGRDCGARALLRRYERSRAEAILVMRSVTHGLVQLFGLPGGGPARVRNAGLNLADRLPVLKNLLIRHAVG